MLEAFVNSKHSFYFLAIILFVNKKANFFLLLHSIGLGEHKLKMM